MEIYNEEFSHNAPRLIKDFFWGRPINFKSPGCMKTQFWPNILRLRRVFEKKNRQKSTLDLQISICCQRILHKKIHLTKLVSGDFYSKWLLRFGIFRFRLQWPFSYVSFNKFFKGKIITVTFCPLIFKTVAAMIQQTFSVVIRQLATKTSRNKSQLALKDNSQNTHHRSRANVLRAC